MASEGPDIVRGDRGDNVLHGLGGEDDLLGRGGNDRLFGGDGDDYLLGEAGDDWLYGGRGTDSLWGGTGYDRIYGEAGNDTLGGDYNPYLFTTRASDLIDGGDGIDTVFLDYAGRINRRTGQAFDVALTYSPTEFSVSADSVYKGETVRNVERLKVLTGNGDESIRTGDRNDSISVSGGNDLVHAGGGSDVIQDGLGSFDIDGGDGFDRLTLNRSSEGAALLLDGRAGNLSVGNVATGTLSGIEWLSVSASRFSDDLTGILNGPNALWGYEGADKLVGGVGADRLYGGLGDDVVSGGDGNDHIRGSAGLDKVFGEAGDDQLFIAWRTDFLAGEIYDGGDGIDTVRINFAGTEVLDFPSSTILNVEKLAGANLSENAARILMDTATFTRFESVGIGGKGSVRIVLTDNHDINLAGAVLAFDELQLADGGQTINLAGAMHTGGFASFPDIHGGSGDDTISAAGAIPGTFVAYGHDGNDTLIGTDGPDWLIGGLGDDTLRGGKSVNKALYIDVEADVVVSLALQGRVQDTKGAGKDYLSGFRDLAGGDGDDRLTGNSADNLLQGSSGDDILRGGAGEDTMHGHSGSDTASYARSNAAVQVEISNYYVVSGTGGHADGDKGYDIENLIGSSYDDRLEALATADNVMEGGLGDDYLNGGDHRSRGDTVSYAGAQAGVTVDLAQTARQDTGAAGKDELSGFENIRGSGFNDTLAGDDAANVISGGKGADKLSGGLGLDTASYATAGFAVVADLAAVESNSGDALGDTYFSMENLAGSNFADRLVGDASANVLEGGKGDDTLEGSGGRDVLLGGVGADTLSGGEGADGFRFDGHFDYLNEGGDTITDFERGASAETSDHLLFRRAAFGNISALDDTSLVENSNGLASESGHRFIYETDTRTLWFDPDGSNEREPVAMATLNVASLTAADFIFV